ncbi:ribonuclease Z [Methanoplanus sp. FWC-SCC4]|uniref:Ribonuclease Z n=1 Tax=Methanochimaera problematica TaxID=2609417 RepID=A0AA97I2B3_9EURY|nr:ribonuclease Z [Methanoplanus sp. FWC-SCC4]WOF16080.1 ribonuclease Z [Methanoplanus sp. FWC-SCC4]
MSGETLQVYFLGTAGALPTPYRNPSCIMVRRGSETLLFDCGEGAQQQMMRAKTGFTVDAVFISHWHADHYLGLLGLVQTMSFMGRKDPLMIYGPKWIFEFVEHVENISKTKLGYRIIPSELKHGSVVPFNGYTIRAFSSKHGMPGLGYILFEDERPGRFDREHAISLGIKPGPLFGRLQRGQTITIERDGEEVLIKPSDVMGESRPGRKLIYTGDTRPDCNKWREWGEEADILIHDATYDDAESVRAKEVFHSTAGEAGSIATRINAQRLALVHISSRYTNMTSHIQDAEKQFKGDIIVPEDLDMIEIPYRS